MKFRSTANVFSAAVRQSAALALALLLLAACGQKGPLVLPGHSKDTPWPLPPNPPAGSAAAAPAGAGGASQAEVGNGAPVPKSGPAAASGQDGANTQSGGESPNAPAPKNGSGPQAPQ
ncbi:MAG TPA: lipoprotein [Burkholderiaceae bacterium]|nr:lipoprotein [Burkholderiaceae bacterium]